MSSVDIAIPCSQYGRYLRDCVASVLSQDIDDLRILIIDNASTDNSVAIARQLRPRRMPGSACWHAAKIWGRMLRSMRGVDLAAARYFMVRPAADDDRWPRAACGMPCRCSRPIPGSSFAYGTDRHLLPGRPLPRRTAMLRPLGDSGPASGLSRIAAAIPSITSRRAWSWCEPPHRSRLAITGRSCRIPMISKMLMRLACHGDVAYTSAATWFQAHA